MPIHEFQCPHGHVTERLFMTFTEAEGVHYIECSDCQIDAYRIDSVPAPGIFLGNPDGYHKPSPTKRYSTKLVSQNDGNKHSAG